ncbi:MAG: hypothetical protein JXM70_23340, partial [Pirellulales bacterium]|nr:hypothetical protein [Pirellulales bacterium]
AKKDSTTTGKMDDWAMVTYPDSVQAGHTFKVSIELPQTFEGQKLVANLNWLKDDGHYGGFNTVGRPASVDATKGSHEFSIKPRSKPGLGKFLLTVYLSPNSGWGDRTKSGTIGIPLGSGESLDAAALIPEPQKAWYTDLDFAPRNVWMIGEKGMPIRIPLARTPNWQVVDEDDVKSQWWQFDNPGNPHFRQVKVGSRKKLLGVDTEHLTRDPAYYEGAYVWTEYGWVMGTPYPTRIAEYFPDKKAFAIDGQWGPDAGAYQLPRYSRYFIEDKPQYLDDPNGEFYFDKQGSGGRLYLHLPDDRDPNATQIEVAKYATLIDATEAAHVLISGLTFRFTNTYWDLAAPPVAGKDVDPAVIRLIGPGQDITVANCTFEYINTAVRLVPEGEGAQIADVVIRDNLIRETDHGAINVSDGSGWGQALPTTRLFDVMVLRNRLEQIGKRPTRYGHGHAIEIGCAETCEVAGNVLDHLYGSGIFVYGGKRSRAQTDRPLSRILIHHNQVTHSLLNTNDWGGIETWQGGPAYVFDNVSGNPGGFKMWAIKNTPEAPGAARFGHAYYLDGAFKQYYFNNIAWGKSSDPLSPLGNTAAFQEIHGYLNYIFNNTAYRFVIGSRRQAPVAGQNKYLGNLWDDIGNMVFRHAQPSKQMADPNAADAKATSSTFDHGTNFYANNIFYNVPKMFGVFESTGQWYATLDSLRDALHAQGTLGNVGEVVATSPLRDPAAYDFRPTSVAKGYGVKVFVPWGLYAVVGEWHFYPRGDDTSVIPDEHFYLAPYYVKREDYHKQPTYPLRLVNVAPAAFVDGPLEDWTHGALKLNGKDGYAMVSAEILSTDSEDGSSVSAYRSPRVDRSNFLIEAYAKVGAVNASSVLVGNLQNQAGYELAVGPDGHLLFTIAGDQQTASVTSTRSIADGKWFHVIAEADRKSRKIRLYLEGKLDTERDGLGDVSLANNQPLYVGGTPAGRCLAGEIDFLRIALGTLDDAKTTIEELYAWELSGPFLQDFTGHAPEGRRDAGAIEVTD